MPIPKTPLHEPRMSAKEKVYQSLLQWITDGTLQPGEKILDTEIAAYFSVSRTPVREALQILADQKLIEIIPSRGSVVTDIHFDEAEQNYYLMGQLNAIAVDLCKEKLSVVFLNHLQALNEQMLKAAQSGQKDAVQQFDRAFHESFFELAGNGFLTGFFKTLYTHCLRIENLYFNAQEDAVASAKEHNQILAALQNNDFDTARANMILNWTNTIQNHLSEEARKEVPNDTEH